MTTELDSAVREQFEGNFLDATDIKEDISVEIADVVRPGAERDATKKVIDKSIIAFKGAKKRMIANKINLKILVLHYGKNASDWIGKRVTLTVRYLETAFGQRNVPVIRIVPPPDKALTFGMRKHYGAAKPFESKPDA